MITLYHKATTRSQIVVWLLEEIGLPYELIVTDTQSGFTKTDEYLSINPMGKLPGLIDGDIKMGETSAICLYLSDKYGSGKVAPKIDDPDRAPFLYWMFYVAACVEPSIMQTAVEFEAPPRQAGWGAPADVWNVIENAVSDQPFLLGDRFSTADIYLASRLRVAMRKGVLELRPAFLRYVENLDTRTNWKKAVARGGYREKRLSPQ